ncbi:UDP-glycosyltransferase UGT5-like isoform X1 [Schistocerca piceifrons]|uniref:UDP-glycosyltransferase UGT5-like isoform X1 n=2 Tax=Schistocerca piceifrons TaxID=274613 RepID=UPI001F5F275D|nr:UDP-glycosyltransferase UGT5-like isoform X1 [Schistocerca piceifrons]
MPDVRRNLPETHDYNVALKMNCVVVFLLIMLVAGTSEAARILGLFNYPGKSHFIMFEAVMKTLAARGHQVTVYSHFPQPAPLPNYKDVSLVGSLPILTDAIPLEAYVNSDIYSSLDLFMKLSSDECDKVLQFPAMQELMRSNETFDLIFTEVFVTDCMLPFVHKFQAPNIAMRSSAIMPWTSDRFGLPDNPSYLPIEFGLSSDHMGFFERLSNAWYLVYSKWFHSRYIEVSTDAVVMKHFGDSIPPLVDIAKNTSMLFMNTNPALTPPRPLVPAVVEIGGIHLKPAGQLPKDIQKFMDEAEHGVIYFTFGSTVKTQDLPEPKRKALLEAFAELPQRVVWKWETDKLPGQPPNVLIRKWLPQYEILSHPKMRLFITHGGLMGAIEAITNGVPLLGIPLFGDQPVNVQMFVRRGIGLHLAYREISKKSVLEAVSTILNDPGYKKRTEKLGMAFKDTPMTPQETVVYWSEYVIRHRGAPHLRSAAVDLQWHQLLLLDVIAALLVAFLAVSAAFVFLLRLILRQLGFLKVSSGSTSLGNKSKKTKQQ